MTSRTIGILIGILALVVIGIAVAANAPERKVVSNFEECEAAGYPIMESHPRQCRAPDGTLFREDLSEGGGTQTGAAYVGAGCALAGCSNIICAEEDQAPGIVTTCEYREEYACYQNARCEKQMNGQCGWTQTAELSACLEASFVESKG